MLAAEAFTPREIDSTARSLDNQAWDAFYQEQPPPDLAQRQAMKLLDIENVRSLLLRNVRRKGPSSRNNHQSVPHVPETNDDLDRTAVASVAMSPPGVNRLLALDIEELVRHTSRLQREHHMASCVR